MEFLAIIVSAAALYVGHAERILHRDGWFYKLGELVRRLPVAPPVAQLVAILLPVAAVYFLQNDLQGRFFGIAELLLMLVVLLFSLGRNDLNTMLLNYRRSLRHGEIQSASLSVAEVTEDTPPQDFSAMQATVEQWSTYRRFEHWFAVVFWFLVLGPAGALLYRLVQLSVSKTAMLVAVLEVLDWLPVRIMGFSFALIGEFVSAMQELRACVFNGAKADDCVYKLACAALHFSPATELSHAEGDSRLGKLVDLLQRSIVLWIAVIAIAQIVF